MQTVILVLHVLTAFSVIALVLLQHGKGADMGAAFGSGSSGSLFGSTGSANFLSRATAVLAALFFITSMGLTWLSSRGDDSVGVMGTRQSIPQPEQPLPTPSPARNAGSTADPIAAPVPQAPASAGQGEVGADGGTGGNAGRNPAQGSSKSNEIPK
ncbi:MAG: preprotein translocase subunit SecG [Pseudomonadota bacterium]|nr:preprotein translocase subunit SecG [Burkholderiales bacterium]MDQ3195841.1 preprotein translocase subunit SecG [Pseudomonadota bacterium]